MNNEEKAKEIFNQIKSTPMDKLDTIEDYLKFLVKQNREIIKALNDLDYRLMELEKHD